MSSDAEKLRSISIGDKLRASGGVGEGFDIMRIVLAAGVVAWHAPWLVAGFMDMDRTPVLWFPGYAILSVFFALSGFLIAGSAARLRLPDFLVNRGLRIFPALAVEVVLSAFILGSIFTALPLVDYLSHKQTWHYLTNLAALINYHLPGVFLENKQSEVNISLWTVPYEFLCYAAMSAIMLFGFIKRPAIVFVAAALMIVVGLVLQYCFGMMPAAHRDNAMLQVVGRLFIDDSSRLLISFLLGIVAFQIKDSLPYSKVLALSALAICAVFACWRPAEVSGFPIVNAVVAPALVYLMAYCGVSSVITPAIFRRGDYSYGIYLYGMPVQQMMLACFPSVKSILAQFCIAMFFIVLFSAFSWHFIEKPVLRLRKKFSFVGSMRLQK